MYANNRSGHENAWRTIHFVGDSKFQRPGRTICLVPPRAQRTSFFLSHVYNFFYAQNSTMLNYQLGPAPANRPNNKNVRFQYSLALFFKRSRLGSSSSRRRLIAIPRCMSGESGARALSTASSPSSILVGRGVDGEAVARRRYKMSNSVCLRSPSSNVTAAGEDWR